jgi:hypothetical protein
MGDFAVLEVAARFNDFEPTKVMDRFTRFLNRSPYRLVASGRGTAGDLNRLENFSLHDVSPELLPKLNLHPLAARPPSIWSPEKTHA